MIPSQLFTFTRTYSRWLEEKKRRETYEETGDRWIEFFSKELGDAIAPVHKHLAKTAWLQQQVMPSMRAAWAAGAAAKQNNITLYNCSFMAVNDVCAFAETLYILMCGTGVGFSVERQYVDQLPTITKALNGKRIPIKVEDSKEGWARTLDNVVRILYEGGIPEVDYSQVRPRGARLKVMGGRASGPDPLKNLVEFAEKMFSARTGQKLRPIDCHDLICKIAEIVVVGGVRRSSLISLSDLDDQKIATAKNGMFLDSSPHRSMANNSAVYLGKPDEITFMKEWLNLMESGSGERGIFSRNGVDKQMVASGRRSPWKHIGTNPCFEILLRDMEFCVAGDTPLITSGGVTTIKEAVGQTTNIWNGTEWAEVVPRKTGSNQSLVRVSFSDGSYLDCTPDHRFSVKTRFHKEWTEFKASDLLSCGGKYAVQCEPSNIRYTTGKEYRNAYTLGFVVGDGCVYAGMVFADLFGDKIKLPVGGTREIVKTKKGYAVQSQRVNITKFLGGEANHIATTVTALKTDVNALDELFTWSRKSILNFVAGLADADGSMTPKGGIRIYVSRRERALRLQLLLTKCGIKSSVNLMQKKGAITNYGVRKQDMWYLQITDCSCIPCHRLDTSRGHDPLYKGKYQTITTVVPLEGTHETFCFTEPKKHKGVFSNVLTFQCNLSEVVVRADDTLETLRRKVKTAAMLGSWQATFTDFPYLRPEWKKNCEEERLLGVSLTGLMDNPVLNNVNDTMKRWLGDLKGVAIRETEKWAERLNINMSAAITCVKPSGTVSQLVNSASGIHPRYAQHYIRRYRISATDPLFRMMRDQGVTYFPEVGQLSDSASTFVLEFPIKAPGGTKTRHDYTGIQQLEHWLAVKSFWAEHNPSITVYIDQDEWLPTGAWCHKHFDSLCGVSFLPKDNGVYQLTPYEEISSARYEELSAKFPDIDYTQLSRYEQEDNTEGSRAYGCTGDKCEI